MLTKNFGEIDIKDEDIITFNEGIYGFESLKRYIVLNDDGPFGYLQCMDDPDTCFVIADPFVFNKDYAPDIKDDILKSVGIKDAKDVLLIVIAVVTDDIKKTRLNLKSPIVINARQKKAVQVILDDDRWPIKYYIFSQKEGK